MSRMDEDAKDFARMLRYVADCVSFYQTVKSYPDCATCGKKDCEYRPDFGELLRINCPLWKAKEK